MTADTVNPQGPDVDGFLHELVRLRLLAFLSLLGRADFVYILRQTGLSRGNLSVQMGKLADAGYVEVDKSFVANRPRTTYTLTRKGRSALSAYKRSMTDFLATFPD
jgi:DNA-binding MarR family transcriptional regulator